MADEQNEAPIETDEQAANHGAAHEGAADTAAPDAPTYADSYKLREVTEPQDALSLILGIIAQNGFSVTGEQYAAFPDSVKLLFDPA